MEPIFRTTIEIMVVPTEMFRRPTGFLVVEADLQDANEPLPFQSQKHGSAISLVSSVPPSSFQTETCY